MERCVNQSTPPAIRSSRESSVDAAIAMDPLLTVANTCKVEFYVKIEQTRKKRGEYWMLTASWTWLKANIYPLPILCKFE